MAGIRYVSHGPAVVRSQRRDGGDRGIRREVHRSLGGRAGGMGRRGDCAATGAAMCGEVAEDASAERDERHHRDQTHDGGATSMRRGDWGHIVRRRCVANTSFLQTHSHPSVGLRRMRRLLAQLAGDARPGCERWRCDALTGAMQRQGHLAPLFERALAARAGRQVTLHRGSFIVRERVRDIPGQGILALLAREIRGEVRRHGVHPRMMRAQARSGAPGGRSSHDSSRSRREPPESGRPPRR